MTPHHPISTLFPYTTLFRSARNIAGIVHEDVGVGAPGGDTPDRLAIAQIRSVNMHRDGVLAADLRDGERSEEHTSELQSHVNLVCRLLLEKKKNNRLY